MLLPPRSSSSGSSCCLGGLGQVVHGDVCKLQKDLSSLLSWFCSPGLGREQAGAAGLQWAHPCGMLLGAVAGTGQLCLHLNPRPCQSQWPSQGGCGSCTAPVEQASILLPAHGMGRGHPTCVTCRGRDQLGSSELWNASGGSSSHFGLFSAGCSALCPDLKHQKWLSSSLSKGKGIAGVTWGSRTCTRCCGHVAGAGARSRIPGLLNTYKLPEPPVTGSGCGWCSGTATLMPRTGQRQCHHRGDRGEHMGWVGGMLLSALSGFSSRAHS